MDEALQAATRSFEAHGHTSFDLGQSGAGIPALLFPACADAPMDDWTRGGEVHGRMFGPGAGIPEDPATGSAAAALAGVLRDLQGLDAGQAEWIVHQGEDMGRPSMIRLQATISGGSITHARIGGAVVRRIEGRMRL
jgi:PhzF family phenazine biosynthesis protein